MADSEDFPVQEHELPDLGRTFGHKLADELKEFSIDPETQTSRPIWVLAGLLAAQQTINFEMENWAKHARIRGSSWSEIGEALGMTKQAAQQRFGGKKE